MNFEYDALDEVHEVELRTYARGSVIVTVMEVGGGNGHVGGGEGADDPELATHVVGRAENVSERRAPQHPGMRAARDREAQIAEPAGDEPGLQWCAPQQVGALHPEPGLQGVEVEAGERAAHGVTVTARSAVIPTADSADSSRRAARTEDASEVAREAPVMAMSPGAFDSTHASMTVSSGTS
jgi:hypothetical protein